MSLADFARRLVEEGLEGAIGRYYSTYRAQVLDNDDPQNQDRLRVFVPRITTRGREPLAAWAYPELAGPTSAAGAGTCELPPVGAFVWVRFEDGQLDKPIYSGGGWWGKDEKPTDAFPDKTWRGWVSAKGHRFTRREPEQGTGELLWQHADGQRIRQLEGGVIEVESGPSVVRIESGKLTLTTGQGQTVILEAGAVRIEGGGQVHLDASAVTVSAQSVALGGADAIQPAVLGTGFVTYLTQLVIWLGAHTHAAPGSPAIPPPPPFVATSLLSRVVRLK